MENSRSVSEYSSLLENSHPSAGKRSATSSGSSSSSHRKPPPPPPLLPDYRIEALSHSTRWAPPAQIPHYYDDFTTIDWVHDTIKESYRIAQLQSIKGIKGRVIRLYDASQGWLLVVIIAAAFSLIAFSIDRIEGVLTDYKQGFCLTNILFDKTTCCSTSGTCSEWHDWADFITTPNHDIRPWIEFLIYTTFSVILALLAVCVTFISAIPTEPPQQIKHKGRKSSNTPASIPMEHINYKKGQQQFMYTAAGSGVAEVQTILSGFVIRGYLGIKTLIVKFIALPLAISSGLSIGKEGPYVHMAACVGNISCRLFSKYNLNDGKRREIISAAVSAGVALAFGSPIGGVLFSLEEVSYYFPTMTMFCAYFCALMSALFLKLLNPYGTGHIVMFEVRYTRDWRAPELIIFVFIGICGGIFGGLFCLTNNWIGQKFRNIKAIKLHPSLEIAIISIITSISCFPSPILRKPVDELLYSILSECKYNDNHNPSLVCPTISDIPQALNNLGYGFIIKCILTTITIGVKVPAGLYIPTMIVGALFGKMIGLIVQYIHFKYPELIFFASCPIGSGPLECTITGVYALAGAGAFMAGATRMTITLSVILFELTGSLYHVLPFSISILVSRWIANSIDPQSVYAHQIENKHFPFLDNNQTPPFNIGLEELVNQNFIQTIIDISNSNDISSTNLREKLYHLQQSGLHEGGLPVINKGKLIGIMPGPELDFLLDNCDGGNSIVMFHINMDDDDDDNYSQASEYELSPFIDRYPITIDICAPVALVHILFTKLGLRLIVVLDNYKFVAVLYRKQFIDLVHRAKLC